MQFRELSMLYENRKFYIILFIDSNNISNHLQSLLQVVHPIISPG